MVSNRVKRNFWLVFVVIGVGSAVARTIDISAGGQWWEAVSDAVLAALALRMYIRYRRLS